MSSQRINKTLNITHAIGVRRVDGELKPFSCTLCGKLSPDGASRRARKTYKDDSIVITTVENVRKKFTMDAAFFFKFSNEGDPFADWKPNEKD